MVGVRSVLVKAFGAALALCCASACDQARQAGQPKQDLPVLLTKVERMVQVDSMPGRSCVVQSLGEFQKTEKVSLWEFTITASGGPASRQIEAASAEQGPWPATLNATDATAPKPVWFDVYFRKGPAGLQMTLSYNDGEPRDQEDISTTLRWMRKAEELILQTCGLTAQSAAKESCSINTSLKCA